MIRNLTRWLVTETKHYCYDNPSGRAVVVLFALELLA